MTSSFQTASRLLSRRAACRAMTGTLAILLAALSGCGPPDISEVGGYEIVYKLKKQDLGDSAAMERAVVQRLAEIGLSGATAKVQKDGNLILTFAGGDQATVKQVQRLVETAGNLEFRVLAKKGIDDQIIADIADSPAADPNESNDAEKIDARWIDFDAEELELPPECVTRTREDSKSQVLALLDSQNLTGDYLVYASANNDRLGMPCISGEWGKQGAARMQQLTRANLPNPDTGESRAIGIILDNRLISAPRIMSEIGERFQITGRFSKEEVEFIVAVLRAGRLPVSVQRDSVQIRKIEPNQ